MPLPDVVSDPVTDAAKALRVNNVENLFFLAAREEGFTDPIAVAAHRYRQWMHDGYGALPPWVKNFCARKLNKLSATEFTKRIA